MKQFLKYIPSIMLVAVFSIALNAFAQYSPWTPPTAPFSANNVAAPLHVGNSYQFKIPTSAGGIGLLGSSSSLPGNDAASIEANHFLARTGLFSREISYSKRFCLGDGTLADYILKMNSLADPNCITAWPQGGSGSLPGGILGDTLSHNGNTWTNGNILKNFGNRLSIVKDISTTDNSTPEGSIPEIFRVGRNSSDNIFRGMTFDDAGRLTLNLKGLIIQSGNPGAGKVLTSNANGAATWQPAAGMQDGSINGHTLRWDNTEKVWTLNTAFLSNGGPELENGGNNFLNFGGGQTTAYRDVFLSTNTGTKTSVGISGGSLNDVKLEVNGRLKITGGNPAAGKVLTSDAQGNARWEALDIYTPSTYIVRSQSGSGGSGVNAFCNSGDILVGGGAECTSDVGVLEASRPGTTSVDPVTGAVSTSWMARCGGTSNVKAYAICIPSSLPPVTTTYLWNLAYESYGTQGQSCAGLLGVSSNNIAVLYPGNANAPSGYNTLPSSYQIGKCVYVTPGSQGGLSMNAAVQDATFTNSNWAPVVNGLPGGLTYIRQ